MWRSLLQPGQQNSGTSSMLTPSRMWWNAWFGLRKLSASSRCARAPVRCVPVGQCPCQSSPQRPHAEGLQCSTWCQGLGLWLLCNELRSSWIFLLCQSSLFVLSAWFTERGQIYLLLCCRCWGVQCRSSSGAPGRAGWFFGTGSLAQPAAPPSFMLGPEASSPSRTSFFLHMASFRCRSGRDFHSYAWKERKGFTGVAWLPPANTCRALLVHSRREMLSAGAPRPFRLYVVGNLRFLCLESLNTELVLVGKRSRKTPIKARRVFK